MISDARGGHVSPGIYTEEKDVTYSVKSLGITSLGLVGETLKGPAFQNIPVKDWTEFTEYFGGTSPEKYIGTGLPKYELPYIAKEYLEESDNLNVVRVLGISGFEMSKSYTIQATAGDKKIPVVVLRSKGDYNGKTEEVICEGAEQEKFRQFIDTVTIESYKGSEYDSNCVVTGTEYELPLTGNVTVLDNGYKQVMATVDASGNTREIGKFTLKIKMINEDNPFGKGEEYKYNISIHPEDREYIYKVFSVNPLIGSSPIFIESVYDYAYNDLVQSLESGETLTFSMVNESGNVDNGEASATTSGDTLILNPKYENYTDYLETYRCAMTPWIVSEVKSATLEAMNIKKLFRFYTISDGNAANYQVKISIQKIRPEEGLFDIWVRDFYDTDTVPVVLERYTNVSMVEGSKNYIGLKIGTFDGEYEVKSKYVTVEVSKEEGIESCVPCGFLGYPVPTYGSEKLEMGYNTLLDVTIKPKRQYFGLNRNVLDEDVLNYKGKWNYVFEPGETPEKITNGFHLDAILTENSGATTYVDSLSGFTFTTVKSLQIKGKQMKLPRILTEAYMEDTIYADINTRKFTVYPYGGFDGWDIYRESRTNTDKYKATKYDIVKDCPFKYVVNDNPLDPTIDLGLNPTAITSDYYAYLAGYNQFANPEDIDINLFATPGISFRNNVLLVEDALDVIEDTEDGRGGDALYIIDAPKDGVAEEIVNDLDNSEIDSSYAATYWPWVKYFDASANKYVMLPATKDVVRNMAWTDNHMNPWFAPAGTTRGKMNVTKAEQKTKLLDEDELYSNRINPIKTFAQDGVLVWGNKTLYSKDTPLNRINVRRLMIRVKKLVKNAAKHMIFDQMDNSLEKQFRSLVEPILSDVKSKRGIIDYRIMTESTPETRDQHILPARILIKPMQALEYISISFVVYPESVQFDEN